MYGFDRPVIVRYLDWLAGALTGDFGSSLASRESVFEIVVSRGETTLFLIGYATVLVALLGVAAGLFAGLMGGAIDRSVVIGSAFAAAVPPFVAGIGLVALFSVGLQWFPTFGAGTGLLNSLWHLTLPA